MEDVGAMANQKYAADHFPPGPDFPRAGESTDETALMWKIDDQGHGSDCDYCTYANTTKSLPNTLGRKTSFKLGRLEHKLGENDGN